MASRQAKWRTTCWPLARLGLDADVTFEDSSSERSPIQTWSTSPSWSPCKYDYLTFQDNRLTPHSPGYIAGVTNPIYESLPIWDILCHIDTGKIIVHKDIAPVQPAMSSFPAPPTLNIKSGQVTSVGDDESRASVQMTAAMMVGGGALGATGVKSEQAGKSDNYDLGFVEEVS